ncbi:MAG: hypothetical protein RIT81_27760 [Deltaproteobacteria bacterium]
MDRRLFVPLLLVACAEPATTKLATQPPPEVETTKSRLEECGATELWANMVLGTYGLDPRTPWFVDDQGLVARGRAIYFGTTAFLRAHDGQVVIVDGAEIVSADRARTRGVVMANEIPTLVAFATGEPIATLGDHAVRDAALTPDGRYVITLRGYGETIVDRWDANGEVTRLFVEEGLSSAHLDVVTDDQIFVTAPQDILVVDVETGADRRSPQLVSNNELLTNASLTSDSTRIAVTTDAGRIFVLDPTDFSELEPERAGLVVRVNENIYAGVVQVTPVAWSPDGSMFAYLRADGELIVEAEGEAIFQLPPRPMSENAHVPGPTLPVSVAFTADHANLAVQYEHEFAMHGCPIEARAGDVVDVAIEVPEVVRAEEEVQLTVAHELGSALVGHRFRVDGKRVGPETARRSVSWRPREAGSYVVEVTVDDGVHRGSAQRVVEVR